MKLHVDVLGQLNYLYDPYYRVFPKTKIRNKKTYFIVLRGCEGVGVRLVGVDLDKAEKPVQPHQRSQLPSSGAFAVAPRLVANTHAYLFVHDVIDFELLESYPC